MNFLKWIFGRGIKKGNVPQEDLPNGFTGVLLDTRTVDEKQSDIQFNEIVASADTVQWFQKNWDEFRRFPVQDQGGSLSCVWQTVRKIMRVNFKESRGLDLDFSATYGYRQRSNYPYGGTSYFDAWKIAGEGVTLNALMPSDLISEGDANDAKIETYHRQVAENFRLTNPIQIPTGDMEAVASVIQRTKKAVMVWFYFKAEEWGKDVPTILDTSLTSPYLASALRHSVTAVDYGVFNGEKGIFIEDSAHFGGKYERFVPEKFFKARCFYAAYPMNLTFEKAVVVAARPHYTGTTQSLQDCLKFEGVFPTNISSTGVYGAITTKAVYDFQIKYSLEGTGQVGPMTRSLLKTYYP